MIELLVVVAIIAILVSILMPSLGKARELAKSASCMMQMRNQMLAMTMYLEDNNQRWPGWDYGWQPFYGLGLRKADGESDPVLYCPSGIAKRLGKFGSYSANVYIWWNYNIMEGDVMARRAFASSIARPRETLLFVEEDEQSLDNEHFAVNRADWWNMISNRHGRGANMSFVDLHVEYWKWEWPSTGVFVKHNQDDPGNPDLGRVYRAQCPPFMTWP